MNLDDIEQLRGPLQALIDSGSRINANKPQKYWYPLSLATYDVEEVLAAVDSLCSFRTTMWEKTAAFERAFGEEVGGGQNVMVNSGSSADLLIAFAMADPLAPRATRGSEVLAPSVTWPTQIWSWLMAGFDVTLVDTDPTTLNIDLGDLEAKVSSRTAAVSIVHLMGNPCDLSRLSAICERNGIVLLEDCCESLGSTFRGQPVGSFGLASSFSFFFSHHLTTMEGGMIHTADEDAGELFRLLRAHGWARNSRTPTNAAPGFDPRYTFLNWGFNVRPTELQAAFGLVQLGRLPGFQQYRRENFEFFQTELTRWREQLLLPQVHPEAESAWFAIPVLVAPDAGFVRSALTEHLEAEGIETRPIVAGNIAKHPAARSFPSLVKGQLPGADRVHDQGFYIGLHPIPSRSNLERVLDSLGRFMACQT